MFCSQCGAQVESGSQFCAHCGASVLPQSATPQDYVPPVQDFVPAQGPVCVQQPDCPLRPALRHPFFYVCAILYVIVSFFNIYSDLRNIYIQDLTALWFFSNTLPALMSISVSLLITVGLILHFAAGLKRNGPISEAGFTLMRVALVISLVNAIYAIAPTLYHYGTLLFHSSSNSTLFRYSFMNMISTPFLRAPLSVIVTIFAIKANQTALSMARGRNTTFSAGLPVMLFVQAGLLLLLEVITASILGNVGRTFNNLLETLFTGFPSICFAILLLVIPQRKK